MTKFIKPDDMDFADTIKSLNPYGINWSNVPDYLEKNSFLKFARVCSVDNTVLMIHFINCNQYVFGACHVDWVNNPKRLHAFHIEKKKIQKSKIIQALEDKKAIFSYF